MSCLLITLIKCLKGHKSFGVLHGGVFHKCVRVSEWVTRSFTAVTGQLEIFDGKKTCNEKCSHLIECSSLNTCTDAG